MSQTIRNDPYLADSIRRLKPSLLWEFFELARKTPDVISLSVGEPDFPTPWHVCEDAIYSIEKGRTYYAPTTGLSQLRRGIARYYARRFGVHQYQEENVLVTVGASECIDLACRTFLNPGDEVIILDPGYVAYEPSVLLTGAKPVYLKLQESEGFKVTPEALKQCITPKTKMIIMNYPGNPTGGVMRKEDYAQIVPILKEHHILTVVDEIYLELVYDTEPCSIGVFPELYDQLILINGFSKAYSMTGWRLGYLLCKPEWVEAMNLIHQYSTMGPATPLQFAAIEAISARSDVDIERHVNAFRSRRNYITNRLNQMGLHTPLPEGAFYVFANITPSGLSSYDFCRKLLEQQHVCIIPGPAFGESGEGFVRISYAYALEELKTACARLETFLADCRNGQGK